MAFESQTIRSNGLPGMRGFLRLSGSKSDVFLVGSGRCESNDENWAYPTYDEYVIDVHGALNKRSTFDSGPEVSFMSMGKVMENLGDVTGDGIEDYAFGGLCSKSGKVGYVRILSGADFSLVKVIEKKSTFGEFGKSVLALRDVNSDHCPDLAVAVDDKSLDVFSGADWSLLYSARSEYRSESSFGNALCTVPDLDGDEIDEIATGAYLFASQGDAGSISVFSGATGTLLFSLKGFRPNERFGFNVKAVRDLQRKRVLLAVSAPGSLYLPNDVGLVYVIDLMTRQVIKTIGGGSNGRDFGLSLDWIPSKFGKESQALLIGSLLANCSTGAELLQFDGCDWQQVGRFELRLP